VEEWNVDGRTVLAAVFPYLLPGAWAVQENERGQLRRNGEVLIDAGKITWLDWR
jgi:hypothetical protein